MADVRCYHARQELSREAALMDLQRKPVSGLDAEQLAALNDFAKTYREALPRMNEIAAAARKVRDDLVSAETWKMAGIEGASGTEPLWSIGPPTINYVDSIELSGVSDETPDKTEGENS